MADVEEPTTVYENVEESTPTEDAPMEAEAATPGDIVEEASEQEAVQEEETKPEEVVTVEEEIVEEPAPAHGEESMDTSSTLVKKTSTRTVTKTVKKTQQHWEPPKEANPHPGPPPVPTDLDGGWKSTTLMKSTQARIVDMRELVERKGRVKPEEDPYWEQRNPKVYEGKSKMYPEVASRLSKTTTAYEASKRGKAVLDPHLPPPPSGSPRKQGDVINCKTKPIKSDSPLLKPTPAVLQSSWHGKSEKLSLDRPDTAFVKSPKLITKLKGTGPQNVQSKWPEETIESVTNRWRTKDEIEMEEKKYQDAKKQSTKPILPNKHNVPTRLYNATIAVKAHSVPKVSPAPVDPREAAYTVVWNTGNPNLIPEIDLGIPLGKKSRSSPNNKSRKSISSDSSVSSGQKKMNLPPSPTIETGAEEEKSLSMVDDDPAADDREVVGQGIEQ